MGTRGFATAWIDPCGVQSSTSLLSSAALLVGCSALLSTPDSTAPLAREGEPLRVVSEHVLLITLDGVRARDVFAGPDPGLSSSTRDRRQIAPNLVEMAEAGVAIGVPGEPGSIRASGPNFISLPGYTELLTGTGASCQRNDCAGRPGLGLIDALLETGVDPKSGVVVVSSWSTVERALAEPDLPFVSTGRHGGNAHRLDTLSPSVRGALERGKVVDASPGYGDYRPDSETGALALAVLAEQRPRFAFIALGDTDEHAHASDYDGYLQALHHNDELIGRLRELARSWTLAGEPTTVLVTTDHGRSHDFHDHGSDHPESAEVWLVGEGAGLTPRARLSKTARLADVAPTIASLAGVPFAPRAEGGSPMVEILDQL